MNKELRILLLGIAGLIVVYLSFAMILTVWKYRMVYSLTGFIIGMCMIIYAINESIPGDYYSRTSYAPQMNIYIIFAVIIATFAIALFIILPLPLNIIVLLVGIAGSVFFGMKLREVNADYVKRK